MTEVRASSAEVARRAIVDLLKGAPCPMTAREIADANVRKGVQCPDSTVRFLMALRNQGVINGRVSMERGGWEWWVEYEEDGGKKVE